MSNRSLAPDSMQPESFAFSKKNAAWAKKQIDKYPKGRQASAVIPLLWRAQEQEGWVSRAAIEEVGEMLSMPPIRVLEVATFYFMFHLQPVGKIAHIQLCGTTPCMLCGSENLIEICKRRIAPQPHQLSANGDFSWEEVECLGACSNGPVVQIYKEYYEDLTEQSFEELLDRLVRGEKPQPGPQNGRFSCEPKERLGCLQEDQHEKTNASVALCMSEKSKTVAVKARPKNK